ncbi:hypothetical protein [Micromonospora avicenniae]|uniref:hypothetical protein n=1 Tax=Micromonospora avicenniae TaxID=1198245 RepID=UPI0033216E79
MRNWFRGKPEKVTITNEPPHVPPVEVDGVEMAIPVRKLAAMFVENGWQVALDGKHPEEATPEAVKAIIAGLIDAMIATPDVLYANGFRFLMIRDKDYPGDFDLYVYAGRVTTTTPEVANV